MHCRTCYCVMAGSLFLCVYLLDKLWDRLSNEAVTGQPHKQTNKQTPYLHWQQLKCNSKVMSVNGYRSTKIFYVKGNKYLTYFRLNYQLGIQQLKSKLVL